MPADVLLWRDEGLVQNSAYVLLSFLTYKLNKELVGRNMVSEQSGN